jgi:hypothetical protein
MQHSGRREAENIGLGVSGRMAFLFVRLLYLSLSTREKGLASEELCECVLALGNGLPAIQFG